MNIFNIGKFFFLSLGITFVLCCLLVYHFKRQIDLFDQKNDTIFEIVNNILPEISNIKQNQNVLFMLLKNKDSVTNIENNIEGNMIEIETIDDKISHNDENGEDEDAEDECNTNADDDEDAEDGEDEDAEDGEDEDAEDGEDEDDDDVIEVENLDIDNRNGNDIITHKKINIFSNNNEHYSDFNTDDTIIKKINVTDDNDIIIMSNDNDEKIILSHTISLSHFFPQKNSQNDDNLLQIDLKMLNLTQSDQPSIEPDIFNIDSQNTPLNICILHDTDVEENTNELINIEDLTVSNNDVSFNSIDDISDNGDRIMNDLFNNEKREENEKYRKMNINALRALVVSKGITTDASKLKKGELLHLLMK